MSDDEGTVTRGDNGVVYLELDGLTMTINGWSKKLGIYDATVRSRLARGHTARAALSVSRLKTREDVMQRHELYPGARDLPFDDDEEAKEAVRERGAMDTLEIGKIMGMSHQAVSLHLQSALRKIRRLAERGDAAAIDLRDQIRERMHKPEYQDLYSLYALE